VGRQRRWSTLIIAEAIAAGSMSSKKNAGTATANTWRRSTRRSHKMPRATIFRGSEGPRTLGPIKNGKIDNYQIVVPNTWNASPREAKAA
jgi:hydrogenase large subunit